MRTKKFRDPIYGYIEIEETIVHDIVDTATFQRLRNIRQTSYGPLYPSSLLNRFVHSLGVYHLGKIAFCALRQSLAVHRENGTKIVGELDRLFQDDLSRFQILFELACLLHDVGHSPFSHTGEKFYKTSKSPVCVVDETPFLKRIEQAETDEEKQKIQQELEKEKEYNYRKHLAYLTDDPVFTSAVAENASPHEIMSCIVALEKFGKNKAYFQTASDRSFFARCITGLLYSDACGLTPTDYIKMNDDAYTGIKLKMLQNCIILLLHSSVIDVDRLDYIIRDASTMGYQSVSVDYERLLFGIEIVLEDDYNFTVGFHKNAISVIENAVYAHDNEKKWVQSHPAILYESFLLQQAIIAIEGQIQKDNPQAQSTLFSYASLTNEGSQFDGIRIRYLGDADIIYLMKNIYPNKYSDQYFNRDMRRLPAWKSEAEFRNLFNESERGHITSIMDYIMMGDSKLERDSFEVNRDTIIEIDREIEESISSQYTNRVEVCKKKKQYLTALLDVCKKHKIEEDVVLLSTSFFKSNFSKNNMQEILIMFPSGKQKSRLKEVSTTLSSNRSSDGRLIYLFYYPRPGRKKVDATAFARDLIMAFDE